LQPISFLASATPANLSAALRDWHRQALQCFGNNGKFVSEQRTGFRVFRQRTPEAEAALQFLLPNPDQVFVDAHILKPGSRTHAGVVEIGGAKYVLKRYNCRGWGYRIGNAFRRSRAVRTWLVNWEYLVRGVPVPEPLLCLEERRCRLLERSYILMEYVENTCSLRDRWGQLDAAEKVRCGEFFGDLLGKMHRLGMLHGDLKWDNILVGEEPSLATVRLVDLDGSSAVLRYSRERAQKDFARFLKDLAKEERNDSLAGRVTQTWEQALGC
jgi:tRNA A-37 threonylcarbamoyl transferase component Bud32